MLNRWGDVSRIQCDQFLYILHIDKEDNPFPDGDRYIPWIYLHISSKTAKQRPYDKHISQVMTIGKTFNISTMKSIEEAVRYYLDTWQPKYIVIGAYEIDYYRRVKLYLSRLDKIGYKVKQKIFVKERHNDVYYLERK
jgi:hypothetical protein